MKSHHGTGIEWTWVPGFKGETWNPIRAVTGSEHKSRRGWHCEHASPGCINCYAERQNKVGARGGTLLPFTRQARDQVAISLDEKTLLQPLHWRTPRAIFVCSMSDLFGEWVPDETIDRIFAIAALCPQHIFIVLTKRATRMRKYFAELKRQTNIAHAIWNVAHIRRGSAGLVPLLNVWLGVSVEDQRRADERIRDLLATPAGTRFLSCEPLLGPLDLTNFCDGSKFFDSLTGHRWHDAPENVHSYSDQNGERLDWVICGGESGPNARPMHPGWARGLRDQCAAAGVPFFFKQWGEFLPVGQHLPGCGKIHGATAVKPGRMKLHHSRSPKNEIEYAFADSGVEFTSTTDGQLTFRVGKRAAGRFLDGKAHAEFPRGTVL